MTHGSGPYYFFSINADALPCPPWRDGTVYERAATVTLDHGAFTGSAPVARHLGAGTLTAVFPGDSNYLRASVTASVPAA